MSRHLLLIRFSAMGVGLMTVPVVDALARQYPDVRITVVSRPFVGSVFALLPSNVTFVGINPRQYKGVGGLWRLYKELLSLNPTHVADLHNVLRTQVVRKFFALNGTPVRHLVKDRRARKAFITAAVKTQQKTGFERYADVLARLGFPVRLDLGKPLQLVKSEKQEGSIRVGIAPFAAHQGKIYPLDKMEQVVQILTRSGREVYLLGAGKEEKDIIEKWTAKYPGAHSVVGTLSDMAAELRLIASLDVMLAMDSGNMHLAALSDTPVVSLWGRHPLWVDSWDGDVRSTT